MLIILLVIGGLSGLFHGFFNNHIYHDSYPFKNNFEKIHTIWIHVVCGLAGSTCLYLLLSRINEQKYQITLSVVDLGVLFIGILGIVGLLPMTLWFTVLSINELQKTFVDLLKKFNK